MAMLQQTVRPVVDLSSKNWQRTGFDSEDDDLSLLVSVYLDSREGSREIVQNVEEVLQAYGFTNFTRIKQVQIIRGEQQNDASLI